VTAWRTATPLADRCGNGPNKLFFYLLDLTVLNGFVLITSCTAKLTHRDFRLALVKDVIQEERRVPQTALGEDQSTLL
jgi:hypothetical protein